MGNFAKTEVFPVLPFLSSNFCRQKDEILFQLWCEIHSTNSSCESLEGSAKFPTNDLSVSYMLSLSNLTIKLILEVPHAPNFACWLIHGDLYLSFGKLHTLRGLNVKQSNQKQPVQ